MDLLCFCSVLCLLCLCARLFICALWSPAGKWYLIVSIPDLCTLTYFVLEIEKNIQPHHRRRKVFNFGGPNPARPTSVLGWGG